MSQSRPVIYILNGRDITELKGTMRYCGRWDPKFRLVSPLANPFRIGWDERSKVIEKYREWLDQQLLDPHSLAMQEINRLILMLRRYGELKLVCWCAPKACHAEVIREVLLRRGGWDG